MKKLKRYGEVLPTLREANNSILNRELWAIVQTYFMEHEPCVLKVLEEMPGIALTGGAIRNILSPWEKIDIKDYDFSLLDHAPSDEAIESYFYNIFQPQATITYPKCIELQRRNGPAVQILTERAPTFSETIVRFDFSICQFAFYYNLIQKRFNLMVGTTTKFDLAQQILRYTAPTQRSGWAGTSLARSYKFSRMGYRMTDESMARLCLEVFKQTDARAEEWEEAKGWFPDRYTVADAEEVSPYERKLGNFVPRFQRGLAHYNKGGSFTT